MKNDTQINITTTGEQNEVVIRHGEAVPVFNPVPLKIVGHITAPLQFFQTRKEAGITNYFLPIGSHVLVDRANGAIKLVQNESSQFANQVTGVLETSDEYKKLGINSGNALTPEAVGKMLRNIRYLFADKNLAMSIVTEFMSFKASVSAQVENSKDQRGNKKNNLQVAVESNVPLEFTLKIPVFKGFAPVDLKIEVVLDSRGHAVDCFLESPEALEIINTAKDKIINEQIAPFIEAGITVIEL